LGVEETYQFLRWVDGKLCNVAELKTRQRGDAGEPEYIPAEFAAGRIRQRGEGGVSKFVPAEDAVIRLFAHNEAETRNGATHFYEEFTDIVAREGHMVRGVRTLARGWAEEGNGAELSNPRPTNHLVTMLLEAPDITSEEFARIEKAVRKNRDREGDKAKLERFLLTRFYGLSRLDEKFLGIFGGYPLESLTFLHQVVDPSFNHDFAEVGRTSFPPLMAEIARELMSVLVTPIWSIGIAHPLDYEHVTPAFATIRSALMSTVYFRDYARNVLLFDSRARSTRVLKDQKSATHALNHVMIKMGLRVTAVKLGRETKADEATKKRGRRYGGWRLQNEPTSKSMPVVGPPGVMYMAQLLKLRVRSSRRLEMRISHALRAFLDNVPPMFEGFVEAPCAIEWKE
jgi:hypothetical protein